MQIEPNFRIFITGKTQSGKTYFARHLAKQIPNVLIYDIKRQYSDLGAVVHTILELESAFSAGCTRVIYQPLDLSIEHFDAVCAWIVEHLRNITFFVEEVHKFAQKHKIPPAFNTLLTVCQGPPYFIGIVSICQRTANVHNDILSQSTVWFVFKLFLLADAEAVEGSTNIKAQDIMNLPYFYYFSFNDADKEKPVRRCLPL